MRGIRAGAIASVVLVGAVGACGGNVATQVADRATGPASARVQHRFVAGYEVASKKDLRAAEKLMRDRHLGEDWAATATEAFDPPSDVPVTMKQCDTVNAFYDPSTRSISMCYEMTDYLRMLFRKKEKGQRAPTPAQADANAVGAMNGIFFHELGHGLIDLYDLPTTGKEEDAVDQLSAMVLIQNAQDSGDYADIIGTIEAWRLMGADDAEQGIDESSYADEHSLSTQRFYNILCYLYGSDPDGFESVVRDGTLPEARAERCPAEYTKLVKSWSKLLDPHLREPLPTATATP